MTTPVLDKLTDVQSSVVGYISTVKEPITTGVSTVVEFVIDRFPSIPAVPYADQIPTPKELIDNQYKFAKSIIDTNKDIALAVAKAAAPLTDVVLDRKPVAKKVAAKKTA
ncbi:MAG TPA: hypothetical protein PKY13_04990 [Microthrixaceae bacterium]|jgi:hypothetical protein|nr:hypothetical protein [Microthrixaceae bacterium]HQF92796.1 hypothetical protein [Microthrixaceae bacterium]